jgi:phosphate transport system protein
LHESPLNSDLERVGDQAVNIAQRVLETPAHFQSPIRADIPRMASIAIEMVHDALNAFVSGAILTLHGLAARRSRR